MRAQPSSATDHLLSPMPAAVRTHHQLGFGSGGYTGTAGTKPFRFGISTFGRLVASITSFSLGFVYNGNHFFAYKIDGGENPEAAAVVWTVGAP
jgi:hypothetical protein